MNRLITFEGIDGSGKSTQISMLCSKFEENNIKFISVREPGSTTISEMIRSILLDKTNHGLGSESESLLFMAARAQITHEVIEPALNSGKFVICDRYIDSTIAYQGYGRGLDIPYLKSLNQYATRNIIPELTFILDVDKETSIDRRDPRETDRMESGGDEFIKKVINGYRTMAKENDRFRLLNGTKPPLDLFENIWMIITNTFGELHV
ncbi:MAG: dTMP kinase [Candidatus Marinimicrobia bacterium]|nr:dTMP kinase [Candidatus Neomarinimicrobiota bacterium]